jgi:hypothetical protein
MPGHDEHHDHETEHDQKRNQAQPAPGPISIKVSHTVTLLSAAASRGGAGGLQGCPFPAGHLRGEPVHAGGSTLPHGLSCNDRLFDQSGFDSHGLSLPEVIFETGVAVARNRGPDSDKASCPFIQFHILNLPIVLLHD